MPSKQNTFLQQTVGLQPFDAIQLHHYTRVQLFLKNGLDPDLRDQQQRTLLMSAGSLVTEKAAVKFSNLLLKYEARIELQDENGLSALHYAVLNQHENLVASFLEFAGNFDVNMKDSFGNTVLMLAVFTRNYDIVQSIVHVLRKYDLFVDISNCEGLTPLILATLIHDNEIVRCLIEVGKASTEIRDKHFRKSAKDWQHNTSMYPYVLKGSSIYTSIGNHSITYRDVLKDCTNISISNPTLKRAILRNPSEHINYPSHITSERLLKLRSKENPLKEGRYQYPDLKPVYNLYQQELSSSYRKSAPPRVQTPPDPSSDSSEGQNPWRNTLLSLKLKQRRHTIALSRSLPNNISTKNLFGPFVSGTHARSYSLGTSEAFESSKWPTLRQNTRRNSFRLLHVNTVPATAPGGLQNNHRRASISGDLRSQRRRSVTFQSPNISPRDVGAQSPRTQRSTLKNSKASGENIFPGEFTILEEDSVKLNED